MKEKEPELEAGTSDPNLQFIMQVVKMARRDGKLKELAGYLNYFSCTQRLMHLTDNGDPTILRTLEMVTPTRKT